MSQLNTSSAVIPEKVPVFFPIRKEDLWVTWPAISEYLKGRKGGFLDQWDIGSLLSEIMANPEMHLWVAWDQEIEGVMLVCFSSTPKQKLLWITGVFCDNVRKYLHLHTNLEQWAAMQGAEAVLFEGAHPWSRLLRKFGYSTPRAMYRKDIRTMWSH
jgi:hypothetical protein